MFPVLALLVSSCMKAYDAEPDRSAEYCNPGANYDMPCQAVGTVKSQEGVRYVQLDAVSAGFIVNPEEIKDIPDGTRVFLQYRTVLSTQTPRFCTDAILVEWASPLDMGEIRYVLDAPAGDPVTILPDWITCLEDGFLTLHYTVPFKGKARHTFALYPGADPYEYRLVHEAHGDIEGDLTEGIVCFQVGDLLPETGDETITLSARKVTVFRLSRKFRTELNGG